MENESGRQIPQAGNDESNEPKPIVMTITHYPDGRTSVSGPLQSKGLCYMVLELGKDAVREYGSEPKIIKGNGRGIMDYIRKKH